MNHIEYLQMLAKLKERFTETTATVSYFEDAGDSETWENDDKRDLELLLRLSNDKISALYRLFFAIDEFIHKRLIELSNFREEYVPLSELRELNCAAISFYEEFPEADVIIEGLQDRIKKLKRKEKE